MKVDTIHTIPEMEKIEDGYAYPEKYHNKMFVFKDQFILFREASYDTFPKGIIESVVNSALENIAVDIESRLPTKEELIKEFEVKIKEAIQSIDQPPPSIIKEDVEVMIQDQIANSLQSVSRVIDNLSDKVAKKIELEDLQSWRTQIEKGVNNLFQENIQQLPENSVQSILERLDQIENTKFSGVTIDQVKGLIHQELSVVHDGMKKMIEDAVKSIQPIQTTLEVTSDNSTSKEQEIPVHLANPGPGRYSSDKVKLTDLAMLKELGFSMQEIAEAKKTGLI